MYVEVKGYKVVELCSVILAMDSITILSRVQVRVYKIKLFPMPLHVTI